MKQKLTLLLIALFTTMGVWAETVTWTPGVAFNEDTSGNFSTGWFSVVVPITGTLNTFTVNLGTGSGNSISRADAYLAISRNLKSQTTGFGESDFVAISTNTCGTTLSKIPMTFSSDAVLEGGATYYFYWVTKSGEVYTTINERYYVVSASNMMSVNTVGNTVAYSTSYAMPFSATMTIADSKYYRIKALYPDDICYLCSNSSNEDKIWKDTTVPSVTASRYVWKATLSSGLILQNVGSSRYIPKLTAGSKTGDNVNYLTATTVEDAEKFELQDNNPSSYNKPGYIALKSTTTATDTWLNTATAGNAYVGMHNANNNKSGQFLFQQVKKVTFSAAIAVNGGDLVTTIYVATDGSDSFTLPNGYLYSINGGTDVSNTEAASAIAAAGTTDVAVTVNDAVVTYNLIFQGTTIRTKDVNRAEVIGEAALPESSWNHECCGYSFSPSEIDAETETVNITMSWNIGDLTFSSDYASATWYHMNLHSKWAKYDASVNGTQGHPLCASQDDVNYDVAGSAGLWAFVGNPLDGVYLINREAGDDQVLGWTTPPKMLSTSEGAAKKFTITKYGDPATGFILNYSGYYINDYAGGGQLKFWNNAGGASSDGSAITVAPISLYEQSLIELDEYAAEHAEGEYFGLKSSAVESLRTGIKTAKASFDAAAYTAAHSAIEALWPGTENANVNYPSTGQYLIRSNGRNPYRYMQIDNTGKPVNTSTKTSIGNVVTLVALEDHKYKIQMQGLYLDAPVYNGDFLDMTASNAGTEFSIIISNPCVVGFQSGNAWNCIHPRNSGTYGLMCYWGPSSDPASGWVIEDVASLSITLNSDGAGTPTYYATLCVPFDVTIAGATAYTLAKSGNWLIPTAVTDNKVPAGTPVVLRGSSATATATINTGDAFGEPLTCALTGTYVDITTARDEGEYIFGKVDDIVGFYKRGEGKKIGANKAYLKLTNDIEDPAVKGFVLMFDDDPDAISLTPAISESNRAIYNLAGQRMNKMQKGINIVNGKKLFVQ